MATFGTLTVSTGDDFHYAGSVLLLPMNASDSVSTFEEHLTSAGMTVAGLTTPTAVDQILGFYREVRADNCMEDEDGDMLACQWGTFGWDSGPGFQLSLTRQFIEPGTEDEDGISQLSLTLHYPSSETLEALGTDNHWCESPAKLDEFETFIRTSPAYHALAALKPLKVTLAWDLV